MIESGQPAATRRDRSSDLSVTRSLADDPRYPQRRSSPRAKGFDYLGGYRYHITIVTAKRLPHLADPPIASQLISDLETVAPAHAFELIAYCVMPDHVHLLIAGDAGDASSLTSFMHTVKQRSGFRFKRETGGQLWQRSYHDHVLRPDEPSLPHVEYILMNPVRAGLAESADEWPYSGPRSLFENSDMSESASADRSEDLSLRDTRSSPHATRGVL